MSAHTPGPWRASQILDDGRWGIVCDEFILIGVRDSLTAEDAHLIAAAPDLLAALVEMASNTSNYGRTKALAAIAKATGSAP